ncbi:MAG TPA: hypothetical protein VNA11_07005, partial [Pseudonocardia sp.]|nr:hypothetical protein [Pseudonocardia sp.]
RWAVTLLLGVVGLLSLVVEPAAWVLAGGSVPAYLGSADAETWLIVLLLRAAHRGRAGRAGGPVPAGRDRDQPGQHGEVDRSRHGGVSPVGGVQHR